MKFIKEIISGKQDGTGAQADDAHPAGVLDLEAFSVGNQLPRHAEAGSSSQASGGSRAAESEAAESEAARHSCDALENLPGRIAEATSGPPAATGPDWPTESDAAAPPDGHVSEDWPVETQRPFGPEGTGADVPAEPQVAPPAAPDTEPDDASPEEAAVALDRRDGLHDGDWSERTEPDAPRPARPADPLVVQDETDAQRGEEPDPFARLERVAGDPPPPGAPSPFHKDESVRPISRRPRTRLSEDLSVQSARTRSQTRPLAQPQAGAQAAVPLADMPAPAAGRAARRAGRVKTRLLGFGAGDVVPDPIEAADRSSQGTGQSMFPVGWMVVVAGPGRGNAFTLFAGVSQIGRGEDQAVRLDFGDLSISRSNHAAVAYDPRQQRFYLGHGGKANLVRLNGKPVLSTEELPSGSVIEIGETKLRFVALCGEEFDWGNCRDDDVETAIFG